MSASIGFRVLVVDDEPGIRRGRARVLKAQDDLVETAEVPNPLDATLWLETIGIIA